MHYLVNRAESEMLFKFFTKQWHDPCQGYWTEKVKENLVEFGIECDFKTMKAKSKDLFTRMVVVVVRPRMYYSALTKCL